MGRHRRSIHIDRKTESFWQKVDALFGGTRGALVYYELLKPAETVNTKRYQQQMTDWNLPLLKKRSDFRKR